MPAVGDSLGRIDPVWLLGRLFVAGVVAVFLYTSLVMVVIVADGIPHVGQLLVLGWVAFALVTAWKLFDFFRP